MNAKKEHLHNGKLMLAKVVTDAIIVTMTDGKNTLYPTSYDTGKIRVEVFVPGLGWTFCMLHLDSVTEKYWPA